MKIQTEAVITEVCLRPVLWDRKHPYYRNQLHRDTAWKEILLELLPDYEKLSVEQKMEIDKNIKQRWRTARDTYKKEKSAKNQEFDPTSKKKKRYSYFELLQFLDQDNVSIIDEIDSVDPLSISQIDSKQGSLQPSSSAPSLLQLVPLETKTNGINQYTSSSAFEVPLVERIKSNEAELEIEDLAFFQSLQPSLKHFTRQQKLMFRTRVLNIVMEMENEISIKKELD